MSTDELIAKALLATGRDDIIRLAKTGAITAVEALQLAVPERFDDEIMARMPKDWTIRDRAEFVARMILGAAT